MSKDKAIQKVPKYSVDDLSAKSPLATRGLSDLTALRQQRLRDLFVKALREMKENPGIEFFKLSGRDMNIYTIRDEYGFWDNAGRNLFWKFPKFTFIDVKDEPKLSADYFLVDGQSPEEILPEKALIEILKTSKRKVYVLVSNYTQSKINALINCLIGNLHYKGRYVAGDLKSCSTMELFDELMIGVKENPELCNDMLLTSLQSNPCLSTYSRVRPLETMPD